MSLSVHERRVGAAFSRAWDGTNGTKQRGRRHGGAPNAERRDGPVDGLREAGRLEQCPSREREKPAPPYCRCDIRRRRRLNFQHTKNIGRNREVECRGRLTAGAPENEKGNPKGSPFPSHRLPT